MIFFPVVNSNTPCRRTFEDTLFVPAAFRSDDAIGVIADGERSWNGFKVAYHFDVSDIRKRELGPPRHRLKAGLPGLTA